MIRVARQLKVLVAVAALALLPSLAAAGNLKASDLGTAKLVSEVETVAPGSTFLVALHIELPAHWHTYWRFAGDSGAPPKLQWKLPPGFTAGPILWPVPKRIAIPPLMNFGFEDRVDFLVPMSAAANLAAGAPVPIALHADWLVCSEQVCVPRSGDFTLSLAAAARGAPPKADMPWARVLTESAKRLVRPAPFSVSLMEDKGRLELYAEDPRLSADVKSGRIRSIQFFPYEEGVIENAAPQETLSGAKGAAVRVRAGYLFGERKAPDPLPGVLVIERANGERTGFEVFAHHGQAFGALMPAGSPAGENRAGNVWIAAAFAFLGGLILNLMPCVFPVLSMKVLGFVRRGPESVSALRRHGWLYTAGVLATFLMLGAGLLLLRASGASAGWGYQLQSPVAVLLLAYLMFAIGLSLLGLLEIPGGIFAGAGSSLAKSSSAFGDFATGVLAVIVATPCTAPFMGAALGFAFLAPPLDGAAVFLAMGLGLALPYLLIAHMPRALSWLPKPGPWMVRLKQILAAPMLASAAWLLWVLSKQVSAATFAVALAGVALLTFAVWASRGQRVRAWSGRLAGILAMAAPLVLVWMPAPAQSRRPVAPIEIGEWERYSRARLDQALSAGAPVFIDVTADWCLTCKVNEWTTLNSVRAERAFRAQKVVRLRADWTNRDAEITALLTEHDRIGVPLYLYYPAGSRNAKILPQILTEDAVLEVLQD